MNTSQLIQVMEKAPKSRNKFCGVYASDTLPSVIEHFPCGLIVNTDPQSQKGSHWLAMYFPSEDRGEFFDSYGNSPDFYREKFEIFLNNHSRVWSYNRRCLQSFDSSTCGQFCLYFIINRSRGKSMSMIVNSFSKNSSVNDHRVSEFVRRRLSMLKPKKESRHHQIALTYVQNRISKNQ